MTLAAQQVSMQLSSHRIRRWLKWSRMSQTCRSIVVLWPRHGCRCSWKESSSRTCPLGRRMSVDWSDLWLSLSRASSSKDPLHRGTCKARLLLRRSCATDLSKRKAKAQSCALVASLRMKMSKLIWILWLTIHRMIHIPSQSRWVLTAWKTWSHLVSSRRSRMRSLIKSCLNRPWQVFQGRSL